MRVSLANWTTNWFSRCKSYPSIQWFIEFGNDLMPKSSLRFKSIMGVVRRWGRILS